MKGTEIAWDGLPVRRSCRLLAMSTTTQKSSPSPSRSSTPPPLETHIDDYPTPLPVPPIPQLQNLETIDLGDIGEFDQDFFDSQEQDIEGRESSCEELEEDEFDDGIYGFDEVRSLEELWWPPELLHDRNNFLTSRKKPRHMPMSSNYEQENANTSSNIGEVREQMGVNDNNHQPARQDLRTLESPQVYHRGPLEHQDAGPSHAYIWEDEVHYGASEENTLDENLEVPSTLQYDSASDMEMGYAEMDMNEEENVDDDGSIGDVTSVKYMYRDSTWSQDFFTYKPEPQKFIGYSTSKYLSRQFPTFLGLFDLFWPFWIVRAIVAERNRYATTVNDNGKTYGGAHWEEFTIAEFKVFIAITLYMGMKHQPNVKSYWYKEGSFFHCPTISALMSRNRFQLLTKCLHVTNPSNYVSDKAMLGYDKMGQVRWLLKAIRDNCKNAWHLGKFVTIDEMMIRYKGTYCPARQYMPQKPEKWGLKVWCLADSKSKYVSNFEIYCGKNPNLNDETLETRGLPGEARLAHNVVLRLMAPSEGKGHVVTMDNFFSSISLFKDLLEKGTYATGTIRCNRVGLPHALKDTKAFNRNPQGTLDWRMHESRQMNSIVWKDKKPVLIISTHAMPIQFPCQFPVASVPRRSGSQQNKIQTSPVHLEYTTYMRGVDVADQLRASYTCQTRSHKWWHRVFFFLVDTSIVNMYIIYLDKCKLMQPPRPPMSHLQFRTQLCGALSANWLKKKRLERVEAPRHIQVCYPVFSKFRRACVVCNDGTLPLTRPKTYCPTCDNKFMCYKKGCFASYHKKLK